MLFSIFFVFAVACTVVEASAPPKNCVPVLDGTASSLKKSSSSVARPTSSKNVLQPSGSVEVVGNNDSCSCGYVLTKHNNAYFRHHFATNFSELPKGPAANGNSFEQHGWIITADEKLGGASPDGVKCTGKASNIRISGQGILELVMPGGQNTATKELFGAEMKFYAPAAHGVFTVNSKVSKEPGACQAFWTNYHDKQAGNKDEQDIEILGHALMDVGTLGAGEYGLWMTNWDPNDPTNERRNHTTWHFPTDPSLDFHDYTIAWLDDATRYYYDGAELNSPKTNYAINPSDMTINCWANANKGWSQGPPVNDVILQVRSVDFYYEKEVGEGVTSTGTKTPGGSRRVLRLA